VSRQNFEYVTTNCYNGAYIVSDAIGGLGFVSCGKGICAFVGDKNLTAI
jgi:hypothetical protein